MKPREIRKVERRELVEGWLCVDTEPRPFSNWIVFFSGRKQPLFRSVGTGKAWTRGPPVSGGKIKTWNDETWKEDYGSTPLPKPGECEGVRLELQEGES